MEIQESNLYNQELKWVLKGHYFILWPFGVMTNPGTVRVGTYFSPNDNIEILSKHTMPLIIWVLLIRQVDLLALLYVDSALQFFIMNYRTWNSPFSFTSMYFSYSDFYLVFFPMIFLFVYWMIPIYSSIISSDIMHSRKPMHFKSGLGFLFCIPVPFHVHLGITTFSFVLHVLKFFTTWNWKLLVSGTVSYLYILYVIYLEHLQTFAKCNEIKWNWTNEDIKWTWCLHKEN